MAAPTAYMLWTAVGTTCDRGRGQSCVADPVACAIRMAIGYIASILRLTRDASSYLIARGCARACGATVCTGDGSPTQGQPAQHGSSRPPHHDLKALSATFFRLQLHLPPSALRSVECPSCPGHEAATPFCSTHPSQRIAELVEGQVPTESVPACYQAAPFTLYALSWSRPGCGAWSARYPCV